MLFAFIFFIYGIPEPYNVKEQLFNVLSERQAIPECPPASNSPSVTRFIRYEHLQARCYIDFCTASTGPDKIMFQGKILGIT